LPLVLEQRANLDGNETDDRMHFSNPVSPDIFGCPAGSKNTGFYCEYYWLDHKFRSTLLRMRVGFDLWRVDRWACWGITTRALLYLGTLAMSMSWERRS
jgi:hypothetical protein